MPLLTNIGLLATCRDQGSPSDIYPIQDAAIAWSGETIEWVGTERELPERYAGEKRYDAEGNLVIPGLIDCHTHLAFGGWRSEEFAMRLRGRSYLEIAQSGGGILSTVKATREASEEFLYQKSATMLQEMASLGVTAVEAKSGYGLSVEDEVKILEVYRRLAADQDIAIVPTFLGAHTIPAEYKGDREGYIRLVEDQMLPRVANQGLAEFCDIFVEESAFSAEEARRILMAARKVGLTPKLHADQLTSCGGAELAAEVEAVSADHLEKISKAGIKAMAGAGVVGVTLPLASLYTRQAPLQCRSLIEAGVEVAVATDFNPGSAPSYDLPLAMMLACNQGGLTPAEALKGATLYAARAVNRDHQMGSVEEGKLANFAVIAAPDPNFWMYHYRPNCCLQTFLKGHPYS